jgi:hypothetical protein
MDVKRMTNNSVLLRDILIIWDIFRTDARNNKTFSSEVSQCLIGACIELSTPHQNNLVD